MNDNVDDLTPNDALIERLNKLESTMKTLVVGFIVTVTCSLVIMWISYRSHSAREYSLVDGDGIVRASLFIDSFDNAPVLEMYGRDDIPRISLRLDEHDSPVISIEDENGVRIVMTEKQRDLILEQVK